MSTSTYTSVRSEKRRGFCIPPLASWDTMVMAHPDETSPGVWVHRDRDVGYCELGDECRNPISEAHADWIDQTADSDPDEE